MEETQSQYLYCQAEGFWKCAQELYSWRGYKPILLQKIGVFFLALAQGNVRVSIFLLNLTCMVIFVHFLFLWLRVRLEETRAALVTLLLATVPWFLGNAYRFGSELPTIAALTAGFFYLEAAQTFARIRSACLAGIAIGFAFCIRPVETGMVSIVPVGFLLYELCRREGKRAFIFFALPLVLPISFLVGYIVRFFPPANELAPLYSWGGLALVSLYFLLAYSLRKRLQLSVGFLLFFAGAYLLPMFWLYPFIPRVVFWLVSANFDWQTEISGHRGGLSYFAFIWEVFLELGKSALMLLCLGVAWRFFFTPRKTEFRIPREDLLLIAAAVLPIFLGSFSPSGDVRYYMVGFPFLGVALARTALSGARKSFLDWVPDLAIAGLICAQAFFLLSYIWQIPQIRFQFASRDTLCCKSNLQPLRQPDPAPRMATWIAGNIGLPAKTAPIIVLETEYPEERKDNEANAIFIACREAAGSACPFRTLFPLWDSRAPFETSQAARKFASHYSYLLLGPSEGGEIREFRKAAFVKHLMRIADLEQEKLKDYGLEYVDRIQFDWGGEPAVRTYYLLRSLLYARDSGSTK